MQEMNHAGKMRQVEMIVRAIPVIVLTTLILKQWKKETLSLNMVMCDLLVEQKMKEQCRQVIG
jgi:hypothetical protein